MEYGLIGEKLAHSFSKIVHEKIADYSYELTEVPNDRFDRFMKSADFKAINVTIPYKQAVIPYLNEISDTARRIGAVNTIVNHGGRLCGYNTDFSGLKALILKNGISLQNKKVLVLGSGGTSKTAFAASESLGAREIYRVSRGGRDGAVTYDTAVSQHSDAEIIINTTPCGMYPNIGKTAVNINLFPNLEGAVDAVYNPLSSALVTAAREKGITACGGLYMLVAQAVYASEKFTGTHFPENVIDSVFSEISLQKTNLVLIGMPGCGKTTAGKLLAKRLNKRFYDSDDEIVKCAGITVPEYFAKYGEQGFRELESRVLRGLAAEQSAVIATGGGAVLNYENIRLLKENGVIVFIDRPLERLVTSSDRPLSKNREMLEKRYNERYDIYCRAADIKIAASDDLSENIDKIYGAFLNENSCT